MKLTWLSNVYEWGIVAVLLLIVLHAPFTVAAGGLLPDYATVVKAWKEILLTVLGAMAVILLYKRALWGLFLRSWVVRLSFIFIAVHLVMAFAFGGQIESIVAGLMIDLRFIAMFLLLYALILLRPDAYRRIIKTVAAGAVVIVGFGLLQITVLPDDVLRGIGYSRETITPFTTIDSNPDYVRINSTLRGPNPLGAVVVIYAALALSYLIIQRRLNTRRAVIGLATLVGSTAVLFATYSRSAYLAFVGSLAVVVLATVRVSKKLVIAGLTSAVILTGCLVLVSSSDWYSNVILHEDPESTVLTKSNDGHIESFKFGAERFVDQPFGAGIGSTGSASLYDTNIANDSIIENYYFVVAHESGWLGLAVFVGLSGAVLATLWKARSDWAALGIFASGLGISFIAILLPVWSDETVALIWWGLAGALCAQSAIIGSRHGRTTRKQTTAGAS